MGYSIFKIFNNTWRIFIFSIVKYTGTGANATVGHQIRVNGLNIGWTDTPGEEIVQKEVHKKESTWLHDAEKKTPFKRLTKPIDVARGLAFLCSKESGLMTGSIVDFDQTVHGWHSYTAYETSILDDSLLGE